jgi:hypothetical protein
MRMSRSRTYSVSNSVWRSNVGYHEMGGSCRRARNVVSSLMPNLARRVMAWGTKSSKEAVKRMVRPSCGGSWLVRLWISTVSSLSCAVLLVGLGFDVNVVTGVERDVRSDGAGFRPWCRSGREFVVVGVRVGSDNAAVRRVDTTILGILYSVVVYG